MIIPWQRLSADTLQALMEEYVTRDGTDYGVREIPLEERVYKLRKMLNDGEVIISYDEETGSCTFLSSDSSQ